MILVLAVNDPHTQCQFQAEDTQIGMFTLFQIEVNKYWCLMPTHSTA